MKPKPIRPAGSPLFWHTTGRWCKKIRGRFVYFGRGPHDEAMAAYEKQKHELHAGRLPRASSDGLTVYDLCAKFLATKRTKVDMREMSPRTLAMYAGACNLILKVFTRNRLVADLGPDDFARLRDALASKGWGLGSFARAINNVRVVFNFAYNKKQQLIDKPLEFGDGLDRVSKVKLRKHRQSRGPRLFTPAELRTLIAEAYTPLRAMVLLGINCGFGNSDVGNLPLLALDLDRGWVDFPRPKTAVERRIPLWPETVQAIREALAARPTPRSQRYDDLAFITRQRDSWAKDKNENPVSKAAGRLMKKLGILGRGFYVLRHTFQTIGDETGDFVAVRKIMGHVMDGDMADIYRERVSDARLRRVTEHVRAWLRDDAAASGRDIRREES